MENDLQTSSRWMILQEEKHEQQYQRNIKR